MRMTTIDGYKPLLGDAANPANTPVTYVAPQSLGKDDEIGVPGTVFYSGFLDQEEYNPDLRGDLAIQVFNKMAMSDGMVRAIIQAITLPIRGAVPKCEPASEDNRDVHIAQAVEENLTSMGGQAWDDFVRQCVAGALTYGHAVFEDVYATPDGKPYLDTFDGEEIIGLYKLSPRLQKSIYRWIIDRTGELRGVVQKAFAATLPPGIEVKPELSNPAAFVSTGTWMYPVIPIERLVVFSLEREGANYRGTSILRAAYKHWYYKENLIRIQALAAERHGVGVPYAILKQGIKPDEERAVAMALRSLHAHEKGYFMASEAHLGDAHTGLAPFGIVDMRAASLKSTDSAILYHDRQMALSMLADFLSLGGQAVGSFAMHRDKSSLFFNALRGIVNHFEDVMNRVVIRRIVDRNWPGVDDYPHFHLTSLETKDFERLGRSIAQLASTGVLTPDAEMEDQIREMMDLPLLPEDDDGNPVRPAAFSPPATLPPLPQHAKIADPMAPDPSMDGGPDESSVGGGGGFGPSGDSGSASLNSERLEDRGWRRDLRDTERVVNFSALEDGLRLGLKRLQRAGKAHARQLAHAMRQRKGTSKAVGDLAAALKPAVASLREFGRQQVYKERARARHGTYSGPPELPDGNNAALAAFMARKVRDRIQYQIDNWDGDGELDDADAETMADTALGVVARYSVTTPLSAGRTDAAEALGDEISGWEWSALLDKDTCDACSARDGESHNMNDDFDEPPDGSCDGGDNCRCVAVYVFADEEGA